MEAREWIDKALVRLPQSARLRRQLIDLHIKHDRRQEALAQVDQLPGEMPNREGLRSAIRGGCLAAKQNYAAALGYLRTAYNAGCRDVLCLRWMTVTLISLGDLSAAEPVLRHWQAAEPNSAEMQQYLTLFERTRGAELIEASDGSAEDDGRRLRLDVPAAAGASSPVRPSFGATLHPANFAVPERQ
jgi:hypothetical protein